jgi:anti-sigma B factor antagonist
VTHTYKPTPFAVEVEGRGEVAILGIKGELDIATSPRLETALARLEPGYERLVVDLSDCLFFASSCITILLAEQDRAEREGFELVVIKAPPQVQRMFDLAGLDDKLTFAEQPPA